MESDSDDEDVEMSVKDRLLGLRARIFGLKKTPTEVESSVPQCVSKLSKLIKSCFVVKVCEDSQSLYCAYCASRFFFRVCQNADL